MNDFNLNNTNLVPETIDDSHAAAITEKLKYLLEHAYDHFNIPLAADSIEYVLRSYYAAAQNILDAVRNFNDGNDAIARGLVAAAGHACNIARKYYAAAIEIQDWAEPLEQAIERLVWEDLIMFQDQLEECSKALEGVTDVASMINTAASQHHG